MFSCLEFASTKNIALAYHGQTAPTLRRTVPPGGNWYSLFNHPSPPPVRGTRRSSGSSIVAEGVINEGMTRGESRSFYSRVGIAQATQARFKSGTPYCFPPKHHRRTFYFTFKPDTHCRYREGCVAGLIY